MVKIHLVAEGGTEEVFVKQLLVNHLLSLGVAIDVHKVETGRRGSYVYRGGMGNYEKVKRDLRLWMNDDYNDVEYFTTMIDLYALPSDFPSFATAKLQQDPYQRVTSLEQAFSADLNHPRFIPYIQLHEFEALILAEPSQLGSWFPEHAGAVHNLQTLAGQFNSPELINDGATTAPSKRIIAEIPDYDGSKASVGPAIASRIGLPTIRAKCAHFDEWLKKLEVLSQAGMNP